MRGRRQEKGFALFVAIIVLLVMTIAGIGLMFTTSTEQALASTETKVSKTFYAADSGLTWAAASFKSSQAFAGGTVPAGLSSNTPGKASADMTVVVTAPTFVGYTIQPRDEVQSQGSGYGTTQIVEGAYLVTSTASSDRLQSKKTLTAQLAVYPQQLTP